jgi:hypothetical protein
MFYALLVVGFFVAPGYLRERHGLRFTQKATTGAEKRQHSKG